MVLTAKQNRRQPGSGTNLADVFLQSALRKTGKSIETWYQALDNFNGPKSDHGHAVLVSHLIEAYSIGQWEADAIVHSYKSEKGHKAENKHHKNHHPQRRNRRKRAPGKKESEG